MKLLLTDKIVIFSRKRVEVRRENVPKRLLKYVRIACFRMTLLIMKCHTSTNPIPVLPNFLPIVLGLVYWNCPEDLQWLRPHPCVPSQKSNLRYGMGENWAEISLNLNFHAISRDLQKNPFLHPFKNQVLEKWNWPTSFETCPRWTWALRE